MTDFCSTTQNPVQNKQEHQVHNFTPVQSSTGYITEINIFSLT